MRANQKSPVSIVLALSWFSWLSAISGEPGLVIGVDATSTGQASTLTSRLVERCCQVGRQRAIESHRFNCKLGAREALIGVPQVVGQLPESGASQLTGAAAEALLERGEASFGVQCELVLESCCLAQHRSRNCHSGKQVAKSGMACMDVELVRQEVNMATESFNDCCMSCSLGMLAAKTAAPQNESSGAKCQLMAPLEGQLHEQTYIECCQENLPKLSGALLEPGGRIDCKLANGCSQRCLQTGSLDPTSRRPIERDRCDCFSGFKLAADGLSCLDVDECKLNLHTCNRQSEVCDNTAGGFRCLARSMLANAHKYHQDHHVVRANLSSSPSTITTSSPGWERQLIQQGAPATTTPSPPVAGDQVEASIEAVLGGRKQTGEPFVSLRLCPPGVRWLADQNRCQQVEG